MNGLGVQGRTRVSARLARVSLSTRSGETARAPREPPLRNVHSASPLALPTHLPPFPRNSSSPSEPALSYRAPGAGKDFLRMGWHWTGRRGDFLMESGKGASVKASNAPFSGLFTPSIESVHRHSGVGTDRGGRVRRNPFLRFPSFIRISAHRREMQRRRSFIRIRKWIPAFAGMTIKSKRTPPTRGFFNSPSSVAFDLLQLDLILAPCSGLTAAARGVAPVGSGKRMIMQIIIFSIKSDKFTGFFDKFLKIISPANGCNQKGCHINLSVLHSDPAAKKSFLVHAHLPATARISSPLQISRLA